MSDLVNTSWPETTIKSSSYLKGRIGWQGLRASEFTDDGPYLITGTDFHDGKIDWSSCYHVTEERFREGAYIHVRNGDLLITKDGTIGKVAYVTDCPDKAVLNSGIFLLRCIDGTYDHRFLYHLLNSPVFEKFLRLNLAGSTINHLYQNVFERFQFPIPDIKLQHRIAEILSTLDEAIEQTEALIAKMQQVKAGLMHDLFARGVTPDGRLRPTREQAPELYKESPLGWIPKEWEVSKLAEVADINRGKFSIRPRNDPRYYGGEYPFIQTGDVSSAQGRELSVYSQTLDASGLAVSRLFEAGTIMVTIAANIADTCILGVPMCAPDSLVGVLPNRGQITRYLELCIRRRKSWFEARAPQTAQKNINLEDIRPLLIPAPSCREQEIIAAIYENVDASLAASELEVEKLRQKKQGLMYDLLAGRV